MKDEAEIRQKGMEALLKELGDVDAEIFVRNLICEPFDYTEWQRNYRWIKVCRNAVPKPMKLLKSISDDR